MQNGRINPPSLDLACPQAKTKLSKHDHDLWSVVWINKIRTRSITLTNTQVIIDNNFPLYNLTRNEQRSHNKGAQGKS
jgi:hypothetical protein